MLACTTCEYPFRQRVMSAKAARCKMEPLSVRNEQTGMGRQDGRTRLQQGAHLCKLEALFRVQALSLVG